jgi:hypothetical protein
MSIAVCVTVWGDFWDRFGEQFIEQMEKLNTEPDEVIVSSPVPLNLPKRWVEIVQPDKKWDSWNDTMFTARSEWVMPVGMDDIWYPDALDGLTDVNDDVKIISNPWMQDGQLWAASEEGFNQILHVSHNPMVGGYLIRRSVLWSIPFRQVVWNDWIQWMEIKKLGYKVAFRGNPCGDHVRRPDSYSIRPDPNGELQCEQMRAILREHEVVPGVEFPPLILK